MEGVSLCGGWCVCVCVCVCVCCLREMIFHFFIHVLRASCSRFLRLRLVSSIVSQLVSVHYLLALLSHT